MTTYYVDATTGNDSDTGLTEALAWATTGKVSTEFNNGTFSAGDRVLFKRGETWNITGNTQRLWLRGCSGTIDNYIYLGPYGTGARPVFDVTGVITDGAIFHYHFGTPASYITLDDLEVTSSVSDDFIGIYLRGADHWDITDCKVHGIAATAAGIVSGITIRKSSSHIFIDGVEVTDIEGEGIYIGKDNDLTDRPFNIIIANTDISYCLGEGIDVKDGPCDVVFHNCNVSFCASNGSYGNHQVALGGEYIYMYECRVWGMDGTNCQNGIYWGRYVEGTEQSGSNITIERCLVTGITNSSNRVGIRVRGYNNNVINCTVVGCDHGLYGDSHSTVTGGHVIKNNIFHDNIYDVYIFDNENYYDFDYNCYSNGATGVWYENGASRDFSYVQTTLGQETNGITTTASFAETTDYTLNGGSGCVGTGLSSLTVYDWNDEYAASGAVDRGWREYGWDTHRVFESLMESAAFARFTGYTGVIRSDAVEPHEGDYSMLANITSTADRYAHRTGLGNLRHFYSSIYVNVDDLTMANGDLFTMFEGRTSGAIDVVRIQLYYNGSDIQFRGGIKNDADAWTYTSYINLGSGWNHIEFFWLAGARSTEDEGMLKLWLGGDAVAIATGLNNHDDLVDRFYIGAVDGLDAGTSGALYIDVTRLDWLRKMGVYEAPESEIVPVAMYHYRRRRV